MGKHWFALRFGLSGKLWFHLGVKVQFGGDWKSFQGLLILGDASAEDIAYSVWQNA